MHKVEKKEGRRIFLILQGNQNETKKGGSSMSNLVAPHGKEGKLMPLLLEFRKKYRTKN